MVQQQGREPTPSTNAIKVNPFPLLRNLYLQKAGYFRRGRIATLLLVGLVAVTGCQTFSFYRQAISGQCQLFFQERSIEKLLKDPRTPAQLRSRLELLQRLRAFAQAELKLPVDGHYQKYVDLHRPYVVWNVEAAPEFSLQPKAWWYPLVGSLEYRGYFSERGARDYAQRLRQKGYDVFTGGVTAYSTLGWFKDPVLSSFVFEPEPDLAETLFHELGHQRVFAHGDTDFNEAFATTVGQEGARRWLRSQSDRAALERYTVQLQRTVQFAQLIAEARLELEALYGDARTEAGKIRATDRQRDVPRDQLRGEKCRILDHLRQKYAALAQQWGGASEYDAWFTQQVNNAKLNSVAAYYDLVPGFERLLARSGGDLEKFYAAAKRLAKLSKKERHEWLRDPNPSRSP